MMSTAVSAQPTKPPAPRTPPGYDQRIVIPGLTWEQYVTITDALPNRTDIRTAFDGENLELMTTNSEHERLKRIINRMIEMLCLELEIEMQGGGMTTFRSEVVERGLEPDESYWIAHVDEVIGISRWIAGVHPPPDLVLEVDIASQSLRRQPIYAKLGVPEIWRYDGDLLTAWERTERGDYAPIQRSLSFPFLTVSELQPFLEASESQSESAVVRSFVKWLREQGYAV